MELLLPFVSRSIAPLGHRVYPVRISDTFGRPESIIATRMQPARISATAPMMTTGFLIHVDNRGAIETKDAGKRKGAKGGMRQKAGILGTRVSASAALALGPEPGSP